MKHGPIALIDEEMPVVVIATRKGQYEKVVSNIMEVKARKGRIIAIVSEGDEEVQNLSDLASKYLKPKNACSFVRYYPASIPCVSYCAAARL